ncbi:hypothetical protein PIB30_060764 [Stylosanthes scabra]|uniref:Uncharacterized protein n=1 Tax=Stylosanthes scabra TaxID=79078 RepID=A0ABU6XKY2_9FABA|nr:hypothetical protein [Stylosanthes scabra]
MEHVAQKEKELLEYRSENSVLKGKMQSLEKDKTDLKTRVAELCAQKKEAGTSKEHHGYEMLLVGFDKAKEQVGFFAPGIKFDKMSPIQVVHNGALVDDDEVDGGDHNPEV